MLRILLIGLTILHLGPGLAFALLAFGCEASFPVIGHLCALDAFHAFIQLTLLGWAMMIGVVAMSYIYKKH